MKTIYHRNSGNTSRHKKFVFLLVFNIIALGGITHANNLAIGTPTISGTDLSFTVSWDNSWYANTPPNNWDAVWLFVKYKDCSTTNWLHASLSTTPADHSVAVADAANYQLDMVSDAKGIFLRRKIAGSSGTASTTVTLKLNLGAGVFDFKVFGIEMVKVLNENFQLGDGAASTATNFYPISITSENAVTVQCCYWETLTWDPINEVDVFASGNTSVNLPAAYPKGWNAFYSMKYEITQEQYVDFLNCLTYDQQVTRTSIAPNLAAFNYAFNGPSSRNNIKIATSGVASTTPAVYTSGSPYVPNNFLSWADLTAYLDWACLRPMSEFEFEKICRGPLNRISGEYVWGNNSTIQGVNTTSEYSAAPIINLNTSSEVPPVGTISCWPASITIPANGLCAYGSNGTVCTNNNRGCGVIDGYGRYAGPIRSGFAATTTTNRVQAGVAYYGAMDMGGNVAEQTIQANATGSTFTGTLGDGALDVTTGNANVANWPAATGTILRGGEWYSGASYLQTSTRSQGVASTSRTCTQGGRGVR